MAGPCLLQTSRGLGFSLQLQHLSFLLRLPVAAEPPCGLALQCAPDFTAPVPGSSQPSFCVTCPLVEIRDVAHSKLIPSHLTFQATVAVLVGIHRAAQVGQLLPCESSSDCQGHPGTKRVMAVSGGVLNTTSRLRRRSSCVFVVKALSPGMCSGASRWCMCPIWSVYFSQKC